MNLPKEFKQLCQHIVGMSKFNQAVNIGKLFIKQIAKTIMYNFFRQQINDLSHHNVK